MTTYDTPTLFPTGPLARRDDHETSKAAPPSTAVLSELQALVMRAHRRHALTGLTDDELCAVLPDEYRPTLVKRRSEMTGYGALVDSGERRLTRRNRQAIVWRLP